MLRHWVLTVAWAGLLCSPAMAQTTPAPAPAPRARGKAAPAPAAQAVENVVVTGTRIARPDFEAPNPVVSLSAANIQQSGDTNITSFLQRVPALTNSLDSTRTSGSNQTNGEFGQVGLNLLDLRGLGPNRTLVLVDGQRHVAGQPNTAAVDINAIPIDLIQRVDVLTGAASAVYGADGVSGVVNFVMKRDFNGDAARAQLGLSEHGDAANRFFSAITGRNFADGRGNLTLAYEYNADDPLANADRSYLREDQRQYFVNVDGYTPGVPGSYKVGPVGDLRYPYGSNQGYVTVGDQVFKGNGQPYVPGQFLTNDAYSTGGDDTPVAGYVGDILPRTRRNAVNLLSHYDVSDAFKVSLNAKFVQADAVSYSGYSGDYPAVISLDNPYIPASILAATKAAGLNEVDVSRNNFDLPRQGEDDLRTTVRAVLDVSGRINEHASYDAYYEYGQTDVRETHLNDRLNTNFLNALDVVRDPATGAAVCRSNLGGANPACMPVNLFGGNTVNPLSEGYYLSNPVSYAQITQNVVNASLTGDFGRFGALPGGPIRFAAGGEYRRESSAFQPAASLVNNEFYQYDEYIIPTQSYGSFHVGELFGEIDLPVLKDAPFAKLLTLSAAGRFSDYSTAGVTRTYELNAVYAPVEAISFRGSFGRAVRAPNIGELFQPRTGSSAFFDDPCYIANQSAGTQYRVANCRALIQQYGGDAANFSASANPNATIFIPGVTTGNAALRAEVARTWTAGVVLRPGIPGLQVGLDWYDIRLRDAISSADNTSAQAEANQCVDQPTLNNVYCSLVNRQQGTGFINGYTVEPENVAQFSTSGAELNVAYRVQTDRFGFFDTRLVGGYLHRLKQITTPGSVPVDNVDQVYRPKFDLTFSPTWSFGPVTLAYTLRWQDAVLRFAKQLTDDNSSYAAPTYLRHSALWQSDLQVQETVSPRLALYQGVTNLTGQKPDNGFETNVPVSPVGRYYYFGIKLRS